MRIRSGAMKRCGSGIWCEVLSFVCIVLVVGAQGQRTSAPGFSRMSIPLPIVIEGKPTPSKMYLKVDMKSYNEPFDQFAASHPDKAEAMFVKAVQAVRKNDAAAFGSVWSAPDQMKSTGQTKVVRMSDNGPEAWMKAIRSMFNFDKLTVVAEVLAGPDTMFIWDAETKSGAVRRSLYVGQDRTGNLRLSAPGGNNPIDDMLQNAFVAAQSEPDSYKPLADINLRYQYPIPLAGKLDAGPHPVFFEFDGTQTDFPLTDEKAKAPSPLLDFMRGATLAFKSGKLDVYAGDFTAKSQEKVKEWHTEEEKLKQEKLKQEKIQQEKKPEQEKSKAEQSSAPPSVAAAASKPTEPAASKPTVPAKPPVPSPYVKFVLNADPIFLVFQAPGQGNTWLPAKLTYSYILHQGSDYKITNFEYANTFDEFLQNPELFNKNVLRPLPAKRGTPSAKGVPAPAKATTVKTTVNKN